MTDNVENVRFSVIVPMYNVSAYLPDLLKSFSEQVEGRYTCQYIFVDDGSTDQSAALVEAWVEQRQDESLVLRQENQGVSAARNAGLVHATGDWITFPDPDDFVSPEYFSRIAQYALSKRGQRAHAIAANVWRYLDSTGEKRNAHALRFKFAGKAKNVSLNYSPHYIQTHTATAFFRNEYFSTIRFPEGLSYSEDAVTVARYLLKFETPVLAVVPEAIYYYRKRRTQDSALDMARFKTEPFFERFTKGYFPLIEQADHADSNLPEWFMNQIVYELRWLFISETKIAEKATLLTAGEKTRFLEIVKKLLSHVPDHVILGYRINSLPYEIRQVLLAIKYSGHATDRVWITKHDVERNEICIEYYFSGEEKHESIRVRAVETVPHASKTQRLDYFGQEILFRRILWIPANGWLAVDLDGKRMEIEHGRPRNSVYAVTERTYASLPAVPGSQTLPEPEDSRSFWRKAPKSDLEAEIEYSEKKRIQRKYKGSWVFMDRVYEAGDSAEVMYRYVREMRSQQRIHFVVSEDSADWDRLDNDGFDLVAWGTAAHRALLRNAELVVSSHIDVEMSDPLAMDEYRESVRPWRFVFLQHGVIKDDMSIWLNRKCPDLFITSTHEEYESITGQRTNYALSSREVVLTGLPRFDLLVEGNRRDTEKRCILVAPTWRDSLLKKEKGDEARRWAHSDFHSSTYYQEWLDLLSNQSLTELLDRIGYELIFYPHPSMSKAFEGMGRGENFSLRNYSDGTFQQDLLRSAVLVTDFSSVAFDAAVSGAEVLYFQFDEPREAGHIMTRGYFDYELNGFGPVVGSVQEAVEQLNQILAPGWPDRTKFEKRRLDTFTFPLGESRLAVLEAMERLFKPVKSV